MTTENIGKIKALSLMLEDKVNAIYRQINGIEEHTKKRRFLKAEQRSACTASIDITGKFKLAKSREYLHFADIAQSGLDKEHR